MAATMDQVTEAAVDGGGDEETVGARVDSVPAPPPPPMAEQRERLSRIDEWRERFKTMPKETIRVSEDTRVEINGYGFYIKAKERVRVPRLVAEVLEQAGRI